MENQSLSTRLGNTLRTGWPPSELCQDECRKLFRWFADRLGSRVLVRESADRIAADRRPPMKEQKNGMA